ncbi:ABC transporter permease [Nonlabens sp. MB-3u-79]|uniref:ABC transporter permease n=1 Tax=Nonlabens sp. MB-3u-79 TaxID=2058134 RepID=UPI000C31A49B|nr:ABC transporter permease [Nonlabens sp. MB-3u-79]AUC79491.1 ABC transporter permease [Nonlabens sp. MB-3u-79]|tara:strand:- start:6840 stop:8135 length:1296 start_codon:yes stop_codon:yes gene_type:complete
MDKLWLIIKREYLNKVRNRTFIIMTFVSPVIFVGVALLIGWLTSINSDTIRKIAVLDQTADNYAALFENYDRNEYINLDGISKEAAIAASREADYYGLILIEAREGQLADISFYSDDSPSQGFLESIENKINKQATANNLEDAGINLNVIKERTVNKDLQLQDFTGEKTSKMSGWIKIATGGAAGYLLMMFIIIYGNMVMRSVIEEKTSRIIEIIVSSVKPIYLMIGKITGTSLAGITQFLIWVVLGFILMLVATTFLGVDAFSNPANADVMLQAQDMSKMELIFNDIAQLPILKLLVCFFIYFMGGYFLYASIYTAIGAAVDNETDTQQFMLPVILPLMLAIYVGFFSVMESPHGTVAVIFSYIPLTSPIVMLMRIPFGEIAWWEIALSMLLLYVSIIGVAMLAAKIYRIGILMYGKKTNWKELYKWLRY